MTGGAQVAVLVVGNPDDAAQIRAVLAERLPCELHVGDGSDATLTSFAALEPAVVVVCANLDHGDARSLCLTMRAQRPAVQLVLIGEEHGPVRNALDATDFEANRFVGRPLSAKALAFAVRLSLEATSRPRRARTVDDAMDEALAEFVRDAMTALGSQPSLGETSKRSLEQRRSHALVPQRDAQEPGGGLLDTQSLAPASPLPTALQDLERVETASPDEPDEVVAADLADGSADALAAEADETDAADFADGAADGSADALAAEADETDAAWQEPAAVPPWREPTMILSGGGLAPAPPQQERAATPPWRPVESIVLSPMADEASVPKDAPTASTSGVDLEPAAAASEPGLDAELYAADAEEPDDGADFARALRRKMSAMAERLFPGQSGHARRLAHGGLAHDHHTDIDLAALADASTHADEELTSFDDLAPPPERYAEPVGAATTGVDERRSSAGVLRRGELQRGEHDAATLIAEMFLAQQTARITFSRPDAEKTICFEQGRPVFATSNLPHDRMGDLLFREGKITARQYAQSRDLVLESGRRLGEVLVDVGFLKRRELLPAVRRHIEDIIYSLFAWTEGTYVISLGEAAAAEKIRLSRHPAAMLFEGVRRKYELATLVELVGGRAATVATGEADRLKTIVAAADLTAPERSVVERIDGSRTLEAVADAAGAEILVVYQLAYGLLVLGAAEVVCRGDDTEVAQEPPRPALVGEGDLAIDRQRVLAKHALVAEADYFTLLGVRRDATSFEIKRAFEAARRDYASDSFPDEVRSELAEPLAEILELLEESYQVLCDDSLRDAYRRNLRD